MFADLFHNEQGSPGHFLTIISREVTLSNKGGSKEENRHLLALLFLELVKNASDPREGSSKLRQIWREEAKIAPPWDLPAVIGSDAFLTMYAEGTPLSLALFKRIWSRGVALETEPASTLAPLIVGLTPESPLFYGVKSVPPGFKAKWSSHSRKKNDPLLLAYVQSDLKHISEMDDLEKRKVATLAVLSHGAAYRELEGEVLHIPSLVSQTKGLLVPYAFRVHFIWEGVKTVSMTPLEREESEPPLYLCQGTEIWPSQPHMLGSIFANLNTQGSATEPYAHAWRQIHRQLEALSLKGGGLPIVAGHSMGGALATQIALYSHPLISSAYAFNPPVVEERDAGVYSRLSERAKAKLLVFANIDDLPFWRIGSQAIGKVHILLGEKRWNYYPFMALDRLLILPLLIKALYNLKHLVPSHQNIVPLMHSYCIAPLSATELAQENSERGVRQDKIRFFPKIYRQVRFLMEFSRKHFRWEKREEYLLSQIEIIELHEEDLLETLGIVGGDEIRAELEELRRQKKELLEELEE